MPKQTVENNDTIKEKLEYLGLDLEKIPKSIKQYKPLEFRIPKFYDEEQYKQYRYVNIKDIEILLSPTNRMDEIEDKYKKASPLADYLDSKSEENILKHTTFLKMLNDFSIEEVEKIEQEQEKLSKKIPFKVKYQNNYLWQIYYSQNSDKYFMIVPTEDSDYSSFFYLLKKKLEKKRTGKIFVPIRNVEYTSEFLRKSEFEDIENYLWLFTKDWPSIYEVYDKSDNLSLYIVGETEVYQKIKSLYRVKLETKEETVEFYKLLKVMFILQTELPHYFNFRKDKLEEAEDLIKNGNERLKELKTEIAMQEIEYLSKEKQISTFLECKKTFFGKFKYYFKYSKKKNKNKIRKEDEQNLENVEAEDVNNDDMEELPKKRRRIKKDNYNLEELTQLYKIINEKETELKNIVMDINSLKLKSKNMQKKIENASLYIAEIDSHKKSIFEFWKYSNKDEMSSLPEGEEEEVNIVRKITKTFDYEQDFENFGNTMDKLQRKNLSKDETDSVYILTTNLLPIINKIKINDFQPKDIDNTLKELKKEAIEERDLTEKEEFDIFGGIVQDSTKVSKIKNKKHRELPKDRFSILEVNKNTKQIGFKLALENVISNVKTALTKVEIPEDISVYKIIVDDKIDDRKINVFDINPENEISSNIRNENNKLNFYKINLKEGTNAIGFTNCIFYDNQNKTLPVGQDLSTKILVDISKLELKLKEKKTFKIVEFENKNDDFSKIEIKTINVFEMDA